MQNTSEKLIVFRTYNQAVMWSRFDRIISVCAAAFLIGIVEYMLHPIDFTQPIPPDVRYPIFTALAAMAAQLYCLKCWFDIMVMNNPFLNCWAFKEFKNDNSKRRSVDSDKV